MPDASTRRWQARRVEAHERGKSVRCRRCRERVLKKQRRKTHGLLAELGTHGGLGGRAVVAFVEEQVKCSLDGRKAPREVVGARYIEQPLRSRQHFLGARDALLDRSVTAHERIRDFIYAKPAQDVQHERDLRFLRKPRMAAGEHHAKLIVFDRVLLQKAPRRQGRPSIRFRAVAPALARKCARCARAAERRERGSLRWP